MSVGEIDKRLSIFQIAVRLISTCNDSREVLPVNIHLNVLLLGALLSCSGVSAESGASYEVALSDPTRPADARERDEDRKPEVVLGFSGIEPGHSVLEIAPGGGYYTAILSRVVGDTGRVIAVDPERIFQAFPRGREGFPKYIEEDPRPNVDYSVQLLDELEAPGKIDQVWMVLYYHDTLWTGENRTAMNRQLYNALRPGGRYLVVDHHALPGADADIGKTLHRMDRAIALREIEAAGFRLVAESAALRNEGDPRDDWVFAETRRGNTDRFMLLFEKPWE